MSELMSDIRAEPKPDTALTIMIEEHRHLDEFMAMVKAKLELDEKYISGLKTLRDSWNPEWNESGVWPLISPLLTHINNEIDERGKAGTELSLRLAALPNTPSPDAPEEDGFDPVEELEYLEIRYHQYEKSHKAISTPEYINKLKQWRRKADSSDEFAPAPRWVLPRREREYRRAVVAQQTAVKNAVKWQAGTLPGVLERHQQRAEGVKSFLSPLFTYYSAIHFNLSTSCSAAWSSNRAFSSFEFIAPRYDETEKAASHALLQPVDYRRYMLEGEVSQPLLLGLGVEKTASLMDQLLRRLGNYPFTVNHSNDPIPSPFRLEEEATTWSDLKNLTSFSSVEFVHRVFNTDEPLLPLPREFIKEYQSGIPRAKLSSVLDTYLPLARQEILGIMTKLVSIIRVNGLFTWSKKSPWRQIAFGLSQDYDAGQIIEAIWRKWDIVNDHPLPEGVERVWSEQGKMSEVVWKKTGDPYYTPVSMSPTPVFVDRGHLTR